MVPLTRLPGRRLVTPAATWVALEGKVVMSTVPQADASTAVHVEVPAVLVRVKFTLSVER